LKASISITSDDGKKYQGTVDLSEVKGSSKKIVIMEEDSTKIPEQIMKKIIKNLNTLKAPQLVLIILKFHKKLTRNQQINLLKKIGKRTNTLKGGNYKRDILSKGLVTEIGKIGKEPVYGLTEKGKNEVEKVLEELGD